MKILENSIVWKILSQRLFSSISQHSNDTCFCQKGLSPWNTFSLDNHGFSFDFGRILISNNFLGELSTPSPP